MPIEYRSSSEYVSMPWRNGLGTTTELARQDHNAKPGFIWRISRADVTCDGAFSNFPGIDRIMFLLSGNGFKLDLGSLGTETLTGRYQSVSFPGDRSADCQLLDGPCQDLNIMVSRDHATAAARLHFAPATIALAEQTILHAITGSWTIKIDGTEQSIPEDGLMIITGENSSTAAIDGTGVLLQVDIEKINTP